MIYSLKPAVQHYAWGGDTFLRDYCDSDDSPIAELWYGAHPNAPALLNHTPLNQWLEEHPEALSAKSREKFGDHLPYLLKLLDVQRPLSIQVHPSKAQAIIGHQSQPDLYPDDNHKPESMCALSEFWLLHGFADDKTIYHNLSARPSLAEVLHIWQNYEASEAYRKLLTTSQTQLATWLNPILDAPAPADKHNPDYWVHATVQDMQISREKLDAGLLSFYLLNLVKLQAGEGIFQKACLPHAYLRGQNIEIMATSDNVLRAGLTPKQIAIDELIRIVDTTPVHPHILPADENYPAPVDDYTLQRFTIEQTRKLTLPEASILLLLAGSLQLVGKENTQHLVRQGDAVFISADEQLTVSGQADIVLASYQI